MGEHVHKALKVALAVPLEILFSLAVSQSVSVLFELVCAGFCTCIRGLAKMVQALPGFASKSLFFAFAWKQSAFLSFSLTSQTWVWELILSPFLQEGHCPLCLLSDFTLLEDLGLLTQATCGL